MIDPVVAVGTLLPRISAPLFSDVLWRMPDAERTAYLTFDDGPNPELTHRIADALERFDARGTFFLLGSKVERRPELVERLADSGHAIGNHTYSHPDPWRTAPETLVDELDRTNRILEDVIRAPVTWMRPPYGHLTRAQRRWCTERGRTLVMWDLAPGDYLNRVSQAHVEQHVARYLRGGSIVVLHDNRKAASVTPAALERLLERLTRDGWRFAELPAVSRGGTVRSSRAQ